MMNSDRLRYWTTKFYSLSMFRLKKKHILDLFLIIFLLIIGGIKSLSFFSEKNIQPQFYQRYFAPAVMQACGKGYINIPVTEIPSLKDFLTLKSDSFSCTDIPQEVSTQPLNIYQTACRHLLGIVSLSWYFLGVSWKSLSPLYFLFGGVTVALSYLVFRLAAGPVLSTALALFICFSNLFLMHVPHLRDFSKAPFIYALIFLLCYMLKRIHNNRTMYVLSALYGIVFGIGLGFRKDLLLFMPLFILSVLIFFPSKKNKTLKIRIFCVAISIIAYTITGGNILIKQLNGSNTYHVALLGLMDPFDKALDLEKDYYSYGYRYKDSYINLLVNDYSNRVHRNKKNLSYANREYDEYSKKYFFTIIRNFPADMIIRAYASTLKILEIPYKLLNIVPDQSKVVSLGVGIIALIIILFYSQKLSIFSLFMVLFLAGYPSIQFHQRHYFHLMIVPLWLFGFVLNQIYNFFKHYARVAIQKQTVKDNFKFIRQKNKLKLSLIGIGMLFAVFAPLKIARLYQNYHLRNLFRTYVEAEKEPLNIIEKPLENDKILLKIVKGNSKILEYSTDAIESEYIGFRIKNKNKQDMHIPYTIQYSADIPFNNYTTTIISPTNTSNYFPVYKNQNSKFEGIIINRDLKTYFSNFFRVKKTDNLSILYALQLPSSLDNILLYQRFRNYDDPNIYSNINDDLHQLYYILRQENINPLLKEIKYKDKIVRINKENITGKGRPKTKNALLFVSEIISEKENSYLVAEGKSYSGKLFIGAYKNKRWHKVISVDRNGKFIAVIKLTEAGAQPLIASANSSMVNFKIDKFYLYCQKNVKTDENIKLSMNVEQN